MIPNLSQPLQAIASVLRNAGHTHLRFGDELAGKDGEWTTVDAIDSTNEYANVYNIGVSKEHTYFVGDDGWEFSVWAHNTDGECQVPANGSKEQKQALNAPGAAPQGIPRVGQARPGVTEVPLADLNPLHPVPRPEMQPNHINELANSIRTNGYDLSQAIPVVRMPDGRLVQLGGHHRAAAMGQIPGETTIPARVVDWNSLSQAVQQRWRQRFPNFPWGDFIP